VLFIGMAGCILDSAIFLHIKLTNPGYPIIGWACQFISIQFLVHSLVIQSFKG